MGISEVAEQLLEFFLVAGLDCQHIIMHVVVVCIRIWVSVQAKQIDVNC